MVEDKDEIPRKKKRGTLKGEARSMKDLLTHKYKNYCDSCVRAKMKHFKTHRGAFKPKLKQFGDLVTFDYMDVDKSIDYKFMTEKEILVIRDRFTGIIWAYPSVRKETEDAVNAFEHYMGRRKIRKAYSDKARQFGPAMAERQKPNDSRHHINMSFGSRIASVLLAKSHPVHKPFDEHRTRLMRM